MNLNFDSLKEQVSNLSLYDIKAGVRKVQNGKCGQLSLLDQADVVMNSCHELHRDGVES